MKSAGKQRVWLARAVAVGADFAQIVCFPFLSPGFISPINDALDVLVCVTLTWLVGWHLAFLPSFVLKVAPFLDEAPTWTIAVLIATRRGKPVPPDARRGGARQGNGVAS